MLRNEMRPSPLVVNLPRRFMSAWVGSWFSYRPSVDDCQTSTSAPTTGLPSRSLAQALTNSSGPGVGERTIEPPFSVRGESSRQNGPSRFAVVSVAPFLPLLRRHTKVDTPSEPDISTASLWNELELWPIELMMAQAWWNSSSDSFTSRMNECRCLT